MISQNCSSYCTLPKLHKWFSSSEKGATRALDKMSLISISSSSLTTVPNWILFHRNVLYDDHYHNCTMVWKPWWTKWVKKATRAIDKKYLLLLNHLSKFKIISKKCSSWCILRKWGRIFIAQLNNVVSRAKNRNTCIFKWYLFSNIPIHHLMCQDSGEQCRALGPSCYVFSSPEPKAQGEVLWSVFVRPYFFSLNHISSWATGPNFI